MQKHWAQWMCERVRVRCWEHNFIDLQSNIKTAAMSVHFNIFNVKHKVNIFNDFYSSGSQPLLLHVTATVSTKKVYTLKMISFTILYMHAFPQWITFFQRGDVRSDVFDSHLPAFVFTVTEVLKWPAGYVIGLLIVWKYVRHIWEVLHVFKNSKRSVFGL